MTSLEMINILSKQWANANDIKTIASCGRDKAILIRNNIFDDIRKNGINLPTAKQKLVPMKNVIDYFNINIEHIYSMAKKEKNLI